MYRGDHFDVFVAITEKNSFDKIVANKKFFTHSHLTADGAFLARNSSPDKTCTKQEVNKSIPENISFSGHGYLF